MLPMVEYAYIHTFTTAVGMSPFCVHIGFNHQTNWPIKAEAKKPASSNYVQWMASMDPICCSSSYHAQETIGKHHDIHAKAPLEHSVGDLVMVNVKSLKTRWPSMKLDAKLYGTLKVSKVLSPSMIKLELLSQWQTHNALHISLIEQYQLNPTRSPPELASDQNEHGNDLDGNQCEMGYDVEEMMGSQNCKERKQVSYLVKWNEYLQEEDWNEQSYENFTDKELLKEYYKRNH
jgi:hypothetical protein